MRLFKKLDTGVDVEPLLDELSANPSVWKQDAYRQKSIDVQRETEAVAICRHDEALTFLQERQRNPIRYVGRPTSAAQLLPKTLEFVEQLARRLHGVPGRAVVVRLKPKGHVYEHIDAGIYYEIRHRYHLVLYSTAGSRLRTGGEEVRMQPGELWWFENRLPHAAVNDSDEYRIHLIVDILSPRSVMSLPMRLIRWPKVYARRFALRRKRLRG